MNEILVLDKKLEQSKSTPKAIWVTTQLLGDLKKANRITCRIEGGIMHVDVLDGKIDLNIADNIKDGSAFSPQELL